VLLTNRLQMCELCIEYLDKWKFCTNLFWIIFFYLNIIYFQFSTIMHKKCYAHNYISAWFLLWHLATPVVNYLVPEMAIQFRVQIRLIIVAVLVHRLRYWLNTNLLLNYGFPLKWKQRNLIQLVQVAIYTVIRTNQFCWLYGDTWIWPLIKVD
jgi:hypothetical protein